VATAFTALALFALARSPMNSLPAQITGLLQTYVSVQRLEQFFGESEVPDWVSSLRECDATVTNITAIEDGTFVYSPPETPTSTTPTTPQVETVVEVEAPFQLSEINVEFPQGKLSLIVGPTASGKTTLCLALLGGKLIVLCRFSNSC
jgi:ABC-type multidrug transport system fused ATPase/permease subunit